MGKSEKTNYQLDNHYQTIVEIAQATSDTSIMFIKAKKGETISD